MCNISVDQTLDVIVYRMHHTNNISLNNHIESHLFTTKRTYTRGDIKQYIYQLAEFIHLKPVPATEIRLVDNISVQYILKQCTILLTERVTVYFLPKRELSIYY